MLSYMQHAGWVCEKCSGFNLIYHTRCRRCGAVRVPVN